MTSARYLSCKITLDKFYALTVTHRYDGVIVLTTTQVLLCTGDLQSNSLFAMYCPHAIIIDTYRQYSNTHGVKLASAIALMPAMTHVNDRTNRSDQRDPDPSEWLSGTPDSVASPRKYVTVQDAVIQWDWLVNDYDSRHHQYYVREGSVYVTPREDIVHFRMLSASCQHHIMTMQVMLRSCCDVPDMVLHILMRVLHLYRVDESLPAVLRS